MFVANWDCLAIFTISAESLFALFGFSVYDIFEINNFANLYSSITSHICANVLNAISDLCVCVALATQLFTLEIRCVRWELSNFKFFLSVSSLSVENYYCINKPFIEWPNPSNAQKINSIKNRLNFQFQFFVVVLDASKHVNRLKIHFKRMQVTAYRWIQMTVYC